VAAREIDAKHGHQMAAGKKKMGMKK